MNCFNCDGKMNSFPLDSDYLDLIFETLDVPDDLIIFPNNSLKLSILIGYGCYICVKCNAHRLVKKERFFTCLTSEEVISVIISDFESGKFKIEEKKIE